MDDTTKDKMFVKLEDYARGCNFSEAERLLGYLRELRQDRKLLLQVHKGEDSGRSHFWLLRMRYHCTICCDLPMHRHLFVPPSKTLLRPDQCKSLWRQFKAETEYTVSQAIAAQEASKRNNNWLPPPWAIAALVILGFNEFMTLLRNPLYLGVIFVAFLLTKALWVQLDISGEFRNGALPGILSLSTKFLPTIMNLLKKLAEEGQRPANADHQNNPPVPVPAKTLRSATNQHSNLSSSASSDVTTSENGTKYTSLSSNKKPHLFHQPPGIVL